MAVIGGALAAVLESDRDTFNTMVAELLATVPEAERDPLVDRFGEALAELVAPAVDAAVEARTGAAHAVGSELFTIALSLCAQRRLGGAVRRGWQRALPALGPLLAADPRAVVASLTNGLSNLERTIEARPDDWAATMVRIAPLVAGIDEWRRAGQVAAWRCGMAVFREGALALAEGLPRAIVDTIFAAPSPIDRLRQDPWFDPAAGSAPSGWKRVGSFRGLGGTFTRPPRVVADGADVLATDGTEWWVLKADAFGSAVVRVEGTGPEPANGPAPPAIALVLAEIPEVTSWANAATGVVATSALSFAVSFRTDARR